MEARCAEFVPSMAMPARSDASPKPDPREARVPSPGGAGRRAQLALAALSGLLYVVAFPGIGQFYLAFVAFVPVVWAARNATPRRALFLGAVVGLVSHMIAYYWVNHLLVVFAGAPWPAAALGWLGICVGQGTSYGVGLALARWLRLRTGWPWALTLAVGLTAMDFLYPLIFPSYVANTMAGATWMMQSADLFGVLGLTALIGAINGACIDVLIARSEGRPWPVRVVAVVGGLWAAALVYGAVRTQQVDREAAAAEHLRVGLVQTNVGGMERREEFPQTLRLYQQETKKLADSGDQLVVWPEGAYDAVVSRSTNVRRDVLDGTAEPLLFGAIRLGLDPASHHRTPYNSAFLADRTGAVKGSYDKNVLLVFGEFIPLGDWIPKLYEWIPNASHWGRGTSQDPLILDGWRIGTVICYEDILPRFVQSVMQLRGGLRPNVLINVTNDSWYGPYTEQEQHLALASFRAVEHRRALVRSTNTGISAFIDPVGRVVSRTPKFQEATLSGTVPRMEGTTLYELVGDVAGYASLLLLGLGYIRSRRRRPVAG
jgi:apolipoprotein N-acyltransferase